MVSEATHMIQCMYGICPTMALPTFSVLVVVTVDLVMLCAFTSLYGIPPVWACDADSKQLYDSTANSYVLMNGICQHGMMPTI